MLGKMGKMGKMMVNDLGHLGDFDEEFLVNWELIVVSLANDGELFVVSSL